MKTTKYKSVKNRKRAMGSNQRAPFIPSRGGVSRTAVTFEQSIVQRASTIARNAMQSVRRTFRGQDR